MRCPSCGFENIPGQESCALCARELKVRPPEGGVFPPRAKDRTLSQRFRWSVLHQTEAPAIRWTPSLPQIRAPWWLKARTILWMAASVVPGVGYLASGNRVAALKYLAAAIGGLAIGAVFYRTRLLDISLLAFVGLSAFSVATAAIGLRGESRERYRRMDRVRISLFAVAIYGLAAVIGAGLLEPWLSIIDVSNPSAGTHLAAHESMLVRRGDSEIRKGDLVLARFNSTESVGPVAGMPGDLVSISGQVFINGTPVTGLLDGVALGQASARLGTEQYFVVPPVCGAGYSPDLPLQAGCLTRREIAGRAIFVLNPPRSRRAIRPFE